MLQDTAVQGKMKTEAGRKEGRDQGASEEAATAKPLTYHVSLSSGSVEQAGRY